MSKQGTKKPKEIESNICPQCGCTSWVGTTKGALCKGCGHVKGEAPVAKDEN